MKLFYRISNGFLIKWSIKYNSDILPLGKININPINNFEKVKSLDKKLFKESISNDENKNNQNETEDTKKTKKKITPSSKKCELRSFLDVSFFVFYFQWHLI